MATKHTKELKESQKQASRLKFKKWKWIGGHTAPSREKQYQSLQRLKFVPSCLGSLYSRAGANEERKNIGRENWKQTSKKQDQVRKPCSTVYSIVRRVTLRKSKLWLKDKQLLGKKTIARICLTLFDVSICVFPEENSKSRLCKAYACMKVLKEIQV